MLKVLGLSLLACCGCAARTVDCDVANPADAPPGRSGAREVLYLFASSPTGVTTQPLLAGAAYEVVIDGTVSLWSAGNWSSVCAGMACSKPRYPTPGATGPTGVDAEWVWTWPTGSPSLCPDGVPARAPQPLRSVLFQASGELQATNLPPPREPHLTPSHAYAYSIIGAGTAATFFFHDSPIEDNYGALRIQIFGP